MSKQPHPIDVHVGGRLRLRRMLLGISQEKLGTTLGLTFQQIQKYEKGFNRISASRLHRISEILGVNVQFFFDDLPQPTQMPVAGKSDAAADQTGSSVVSFLSSPEGLQLNRSFTQITNPKIRRSFLDLVHSIGTEREAAEQKEQPGP